MRALLALAFVAGVLVAPALASMPVADACQPYSVYCALNGRSYYGCGNQVPGPMFYCVRDAALEP